MAVDSPVSCYDHRIRTWAFFAPPDNMLYLLSLGGSSPGMSSTSKEMLATSLSSEPTTEGTEPSWLPRALTSPPEVAFRPVRRKTHPCTPMM